MVLYTVYYMNKLCIKDLKKKYLNVLFFMVYIKKKNILTKTKMYIKYDNQI